MKRITVLGFILCISVVSVGQNIRFALQPVQYTTVHGESYWDIYSTVDASTLAYELAADSVWHASLKVAIRLGDKLDVFQFEYSSKDSASNAPLLLEKSSFLAELDRSSKMEVVLVDLVTGMDWQLSDTLMIDKSELRIATPLIVDEAKEVPATFLKGDAAVVPVANLGVPVLDGKEKVRWYSEAFVDKGKYVVRYQIEDAEGQLVAGSAGYRRCEEGVNPFLVEFDFSNQSSGNYSAVLIAIDSSGAKVSEERADFLWFNTISDSLQFVSGDGYVEVSGFERNWGQWAKIPEYIKMIAPITSLAQRRVLSNLKDTQDTSLAAQFLMNFWQATAPEAPEETWKAYLKIVEKVDREFGSKTLPGYKTQMGRVFLQYGAPSLVEERPFDGKNYPYQIWQYDELKSSSTPVQQNQVFIFVDQELVGRQYTLIHSSAMGEVKDHKWQYHLSRHTNAGPDIDATSTQYGRDNFGERLSNSLIIGNQGTWFDRFNN